MFEFPTRWLQRLALIATAAFFTFAGIGHFTNAAFFVAIFPGNVEQWLKKRDGFGLDTDRKRFLRLFFQPVLVAAALWSTRDPRR